MKGLVEYLAKSLVDHPEQVTVEMIESDKRIVFELTVQENDIGKIIGKHGKIIKALRTVVSSAMTQSNKKILVEVKENEDNENNNEG